jgi:hypothetical protein
MANSKEAKARIKINKLLEEAGWRFFSDEKGPANIQLEPNVKITKKEIDAFGEDFESTKSGFIDFLLLDEKGFPLVVLEAKKEEKDPLDGKEQARRYAQSQNIRFVLLSNGNLHYFWDLERGNPEIITEFPTQESLLHRLEFKPDNKRLADERVEADYIAMTQNPNYKEDYFFIVITENETSCDTAVMVAKKDSVLRPIDDDEKQLMLPEEYFPFEFQVKEYFDFERMKKDPLLISKEIDVEKMEKIVKQYSEITLIYVRDYIDYESDKMIDFFEKHKNCYFISSTIRIEIDGKEIPIDHDKHNYVITLSRQLIIVESFNRPSFLLKEKPFEST